MASVEIITIGTEILLGDLVDTNSAFIARTLADHGVDVFAKHSVGDNAERLHQMLVTVLNRDGVDGVITTGGLGPTVDDLTKESVAVAVGKPLQLHEPSLQAIETRFRLLRPDRPLSENNRRQALLPTGSIVMENPYGTAPGFIALRDDGKFVASMPGVPREMKPMLTEKLVPWLVERFDLHSAIFIRTIHTVGIPESELDLKIEDLFRISENPKIAVLAHGGRVDVKVMAKAADREQAEALIEPIEAELTRRIGAGIFGTDDMTLESAIAAELIRRGLTIVTAESCTGGSIAEALVRVPGVSATFLGSVVAYSNSIKEQVLGVDSADIERMGAVSQEVAMAMARGARERLGADIAISTTGIAGPEGGTPEKPVGLVWYGLATEDGKVSARRHVFPGSRSDVRMRATMTALNILWRHLERDVTVGTAK
ncbi:MAG TPA: competence/damage-inducible protein A [Candidatus Binatia bacterium]|nr:competence/damage-inducible protein A [Candidatus Binatia bacterium]